MAARPSVTDPAHASASPAEGVRPPARLPAREAWITAAAIFALALLVRVVAAVVVVFPVPEDTAYYVGVARNVVDGRGLVTDSLWSFSTQPLVVPRGAFEIWMPMPTFLSVIPMAIAGSANWFRAAQGWSVLVSATIPVLAWRLAVDAAVERRMPESRVRVLAIGVGLVCVILGPLVMYGALPDSTAPFAALVLAACLLMTRISAAPAATAPAATTTAPAAPATTARDRRLIALGAVLGLAVLTRSEAVWAGIAWAAVAWFWTSGARRDRAVRIAIPAAVTLLFYAPWAVRDWLVFGTPLPGQTVSNAFFTSHMDVFAFADPPTLSRYLAQTPGTIVGQHVAGFTHDLISVLIVQGFPIGLLGCLSLPFVWRLRAVRPLLLTATLTFTVTSVVFPVATQNGTFLHAAGAVYVLLVIACLFGLDAFIGWVGRIRHWYRPVAWLGPAFAVAVAIPIGGLSIYNLAHNASDEQTRYRDLAAALDDVGLPLDGQGPVIANHPVWLAETSRVRAVALPDESPASVLRLSRQFGSKLLVIELPDDGRHWPEVLGDGSAAARCFSEVPLADNSLVALPSRASLARFHVFRIVCP